MRLSDTHRGFAIALLAAMSFGATTPLVQKFGAREGPFVVAALLYVGSALVAVVTTRRKGREAPLKIHHALRLVAMALTGAVFAPTALAWGLQRTSGVSAGLGLNFEAVFTAACGYLIGREHIGRRAGVALALMTGAGALLVLGQAREGSTELLGLLAVIAATGGWGLDNALSNGVAHLDPGRVVFAKAALGAALSTVLAWIFRQRLPSVPTAMVLLGVGATGYGFSLQLYLLAQRRIGAARTASLFGTAPFIAALLAALFGERLGGSTTAAALVLLVIGVWLHVTERHEHRHHHGRLVHEHAHRHDDGHHVHEHVPPVTGEHSHQHVHEPMDHDHAHMPDLHHAHEHD
jgi:drug/metabolite transporter (DMT)-like permease